MTPKKKTTARGYGVVHQRLRARLLPLVRAGLCECVYCGGVIVGDFDLSHSDDRTRYIGPAHPVCNRREAGLKSVRLGYGRNLSTAVERFGHRRGKANLDPDLDSESRSVKSSD